MSTGIWDTSIGAALHSVLISHSSIVAEDHCPVFPPPPACRDKLSPVLFHPYTRVLNKSIELGQLDVVLDVSSRSSPGDRETCNNAAGLLALLP